MQTIGEKTSDTIIIERMMMELSVGSELTYEQMSRALGRDAKKHCTSNIQSAKRSCERNGVILGAIRGVGYKRLDDSGIVKAAQSDTQRILRASRRGIRRLSVANYDSLNSDQKREHTTAAAQLGAAAHFASASARKKIESKVNGSQVIALGETLKLFTE